MLMLPCNVETGEMSAPVAAAAAAASVSPEKSGREQRAEHSNVITAVTLYTYTLNFSALEPGADAGALARMLALRRAAVLSIESFVFMQIMYARARLSELISHCSCAMYTYYV